MKYLDFNMSADYCSDWGYLEALREVVQNALDLNIDEAMFQISGSSIYIDTFESVIPIECFTMGVSKKSEDSIGKYGEGLKLAMMILTRIGANPTLTTSNYTVKGQFIPNPITGVETFNLVFKEYEKHINNTHFICDVLPEFDTRLIKAKITPFGNFLGRPKRFEVVDMPAGNIYVNGLFVCNSEGLNYAYNFNPSCITLNRDRNAAINVLTTLAFEYSIQDDVDLMFELIESEAKDIEYLNWYLNDSQKAKLKDLFDDKYGPNVSIAQPGTRAIGGSVGFGYTAYNIYKDAGVRTVQPKPDPNSPQQVVKAFFENNKKFMRRDERKNYQALIRASKNWRLNDVY